MLDAETWMSSNTSTVGCSAASASTIRRAAKNKVWRSAATPAVPTPISMAMCEATSAPSPPSSDSTARSSFPEAVAISSVSNMPGNLLHLGGERPVRSHLAIRQRSPTDDTRIRTRGEV